MYPETREKERESWEKRYWGVFGGWGTSETA